MHFKVLLHYCYTKVGHYWTGYLVQNINILVVQKMFTFEQVS